MTFADYLMPTAREVPALLILITEDAPSPLNPLGLKGAGEGGANPVGAAIASAIDDALRLPGAVTQLPITPQRLKALILIGSKCGLIAALVPFDTARERHADMARKHQRVARRAVVEHLAPADASPAPRLSSSGNSSPDNRPAADDARRRR